MLSHNLTMAGYLGAALDKRLGAHVKLRSSDSVLLLDCGRRGRTTNTLRPRASSTSSGMQRQHQKGSYGLRHNGPSLRGFSGDSSSCSTRCSALYAAALQLARSQVRLAKGILKVSKAQTCKEAIFLCVIVFHNASSVLLIPA